MVINIVMCNISDCCQQLHMHDGDYVSSTTLLSQGADYAAASRSEYTKILFLLSKGMVCSVTALVGCLAQLHVFLYAA